MRGCGSALLLLMMIPLAGPRAAGQNSPPPPPSDQPGSPYTLRVNTRVVLTDVTVTDAKGNPVQGLTQRDFRILDNKRPQQIASFEAHTAQPAPPGLFAGSEGKVFSNDVAAHPPPVVNVLLIDTTTIGLVDQMYLFEQLTHFVRDLPPGEPVAVFLRSGAMTLPLQGFTTNKQLLMTAIREAVPHFRVPGYWYRTGYDTLWQIASYLSQVPGRKNILWFSGGSNLYLNPDPAVTQMPRRPLYDMLEKRRIAVYPIDARGLTVSWGMWMAAQQQQMDADAAATGGHAYYNDNGLAAVAEQVIRTDGDYYTLTYEPDDLHQDGKWHKVTIEVDGNPRHYHLSYRRGYYDDGRNNERPEPAMRTLLRKDGSTVAIPSDRSRPILFRATVMAAAEAGPEDLPTKPLKKGQTAYRIHYIVPAREIVPKSMTGNQGVDEVAAAILAVDHQGEPITRIAEKATIQVDEAKIHADARAVLVFDQQINLPRGQDYLDIGLWDLTTGRVGMLTMPLAVSKTPKPHSN